MNKKAHTDYPSGIPNWILYIPIFVAIVLIPSFVRFCIVDSHMEQYDWFGDMPHVADLFNYSKQVIAFILDFVVLILLFFLGVHKELSLPKTFIPVIIIGFMTLLASIFSVNHYVSFLGFYENMESFFVLFGYGLMFYYTYIVVKTRNCPEVILYASIIVIGYIGFIAFTQFINHDFIFSKLGKLIFIPGYYDSYRATLEIPTGAGSVYGTLMNPNYVGVFSCIFVPFLMVLSFSISKKKQIVPYLILAIAIMFCLVGCGSKTAVIAIVPVMIFMIICFGKKHWKKIIPVFAIYILIFFILNIFTSLFGNVLDRITEEYASFKEYDLRSIDMTDDYILVNFKDQPLYVQYLISDDNKISPQLIDEFDKVLTYTSDNDIITIDDPRFEGLHLYHYIDESYNEGYFIYSDDDITSFFIYYSSADETYYYTNAHGRATKIQSSESFDCPLFHIMGGFSGRGYIWSKTIPLLKQTLIIGSGPDTYPILYPHDDYVELNHQYTKFILTTKPHCMYLQMGIQIGVVSLIAYLIFYILYFFQSLRIYFGSNLETPYERIGAAIFIASTCFAIAALVHDSAVSTSFIYWSLLGAGFACNHIQKKERKNSKKNEQKICS